MIMIYLLYAALSSVRVQQRILEGALPGTALVSLSLGAACAKVPIAVCEERDRDRAGLD
jgi:hypothetical protein